VGEKVERSYGRKGSFQGRNYRFSVANITDGGNRLPDTTSTIYLYKNTAIILTKRYIQRNRRLS